MHTCQSRRPSRRPQSDFCPKSLPVSYGSPRKQMVALILCPLRDMNTFFLLPPNDYHWKWKSLNNQKLKINRLYLLSRQSDIGRVFEEISGNFGESCGRKKIHRHFHQFPGKILPFCHYPTFLPLLLPFWIPVIYFTSSSRQQLYNISTVKVKLNNVQKPLLAIK